MVELIFSILGVIVLLGVVWGALCMVTGEKNIGNTIMVNCFTAMVLFIILLSLFNLHGAGNGSLEGRCIGDHSIAVGLYAREIGLEQELAGAVYVYNLITSIVTNAVKTVPLSQIAGQQILNQALEQVEECVAKAKEVEKEDLGVGGTQMDIAAMNHETLYSRLYMS